jgi:site-specific DNA-adenine methylase
MQHVCRHNLATAGNAAASEEQSFAEGFAGGGAVSWMWRAWTAEHVQAVMQQVNTNC